MNQQINFRRPILVSAFMKINDDLNTSDWRELNPLTVCLILLFTASLIQNTYIGS